MRSFVYGSVFLLIMMAIGRIPTKLLEEINYESNTLERANVRYKVDHALLNINC